MEVEKKYSELLQPRCSSNIRMAIKLNRAVRFHCYTQCPDLNNEQDIVAADIMRNEMMDFSLRICDVCYNKNLDQVLHRTRIL